MGAGIDYGRGTGANTDPATGIRFGVINVNALGEFANESFEGIYPRSCPDCGGDVVDYSDVPEEQQEAAEHWRRKRGRCDDYACLTCERVYGSEDVFGDDPSGHECTDSDYSATMDEYGDVFVTRSPFFTRARFCSPCAPGAVHLENPDPDGARGYCFGHDWFSGDVAPYPVYDVQTGAEIFPPSFSVESLHSGIRVSAMHKGARVSRLYVGMTREEAQSEFRAELGSAE